MGHAKGILAARKALEAMRARIASHKTEPRDFEPDVLRTFYTDCAVLNTPLIDGSGTHRMEIEDCTLGVESRQRPNRDVFVNGELLWFYCDRYGAPRTVTLTLREYQIVAMTMENEVMYIDNPANTPCRRAVATGKKHVRMHLAVPPSTPGLDEMPPT